MRRSKSKVCSSCRTSKPVTEFTPSRTKSDGLDSRCRACNAERKQKARGTFERNQERERLLASGSKLCTHCGEMKLLAEFKLQKRKGGEYPTSWCRACSNALSREAMREHCKKPEVRLRMTEYAREYEKRPERVEKHKQRSRERMQRPEVKTKFAAYLAEYSARPGARKRATERSAKWVVAHPEAARASWRRYYQTEHGRLAHRLTQATRRARIKGNGGKLTREEWLAIVAKYDWRCAYCGKKSEVTIDHVVPLSRGGRHESSNVLPSCGACNFRKGKRTLREWSATQALD